MDVDQCEQAFELDAVDESLLVPGVEIDVDIMGETIDGVHELNVGDPRPEWRAWAESVGAFDEGA